MTHIKTCALLGLLTVLTILSAGCRGAEVSEPPTQTPMLVVVTSTPLSEGAADLPEAAPVMDGLPSFSCTPQVIEQPFENGRMFWLGTQMEERCRQAHGFAPGSGEIYVLIYDQPGVSGRWYRYTDSWDAALDAESDPALTPPQGLLQPVRGFGYVWRSLLDLEQRQALGWAALGEVPYITGYAYESGATFNDVGQLDPGPGSHTIVDALGNSVVLDEATMTFEILPPSATQP